MTLGLPVAAAAEIGRRIRGEWPHVIKRADPVYLLVTRTNEAIPYELTIQTQDELGRHSTARGVYVNLRTVVLEVQQCAARARPWLRSPSAPSLPPSRPAPGSCVTDLARTAVGDHGRNRSTFPAPICPGCPVRRCCSTTSPGRTSRSECVEAAKVERGAVVASLRLGTDPRARQIAVDVRDKIRRQLSVGYAVDEWRREGAKGDAAPTFTATRWTPMEVSIVTLGADVGAVFRSDHPELRTRAMTASTIVEPVEPVSRYHARRRPTPPRPPASRASSLTVRKLAPAGPTAAATLIAAGIPLDAARKVLVERWAADQQRDSEQRPRCTWSARTTPTRPASSRT